MKKVIFGGMLIAWLGLTGANAAFAGATLATQAQVNAFAAQVQTSNGWAACSELPTLGLRGVSSCVVGVLNTVTSLLIALAVVYIIWGAFEMIRSEEKREAGRQTVIYGIIGLFVMVSVWGFVNILSSTFQLGQSAPSINSLIPAVK